MTPRRPITPQRNLKLRNPQFRVCHAVKLSTMLWSLAFLLLQILTQALDGYLQGRRKLIWIHATRHL